MNFLNNEKLFVVKGSKALSFNVGLGEAKRNATFEMPLFAFVTFTQAIF